MIKDVHVIARRDHIILRPVIYLNAFYQLDITSHCYTSEFEMVFNYFKEFQAILLFILLFCYYYYLWFLTNELNEFVFLWLLMDLVYFIFWKPKSYKLDFVSWFSILIKWFVGIEWWIYLLDLKEIIERNNLVVAVHLVHLEVAQHISVLIFIKHATHLSWFWLNCF